MKSILLISILTLALSGCTINFQGDFVLVKRGAATGQRTMAAPSFSWPTPTKTVTLKAPIVVAAGKTFDAKMVAYKGAPNMGDGSQRENQKPLFILQPGATLKNAIFLFPACDGVHANCGTSKTTRVLNCHFKDVGEDAITIRGSGKFICQDSQFQYATDKSIQANSAAQVLISNCRFRKFERAIRACGTCGSSIAYNITAENCTAYDGDTFMKASTPKARGVIRGLKSKNLDTVADASGGAVIKVVK